MKRILTAAFICGVLVFVGACKKADLNGRWQLTLNWDERSVFEGKPPPPNVLKLEFTDGKIYEEKIEVGSYVLKSSGRVKIRPAKMKIICYGNISDENHMSGDISYYPSSEIYGTWTAERITK
jgi:hypothetical protein